jgi:hypothetical protein
MDKVGENNDEHNLNNNQRGGQDNNQDFNNGSVILISEPELEKHLQLIDLLVELEIVKIK